MRNFTIALLLLAFHPTQAQHTFDWVHTTDVTFQWNPGMISYSVAADDNGNVFQCGYLQNPYQYDVFYGDLFFKKFDAAGNEQFNLTIGGRASIREMICDHQGNVYLALAYVNFLMVGDLAFNTNDQGVQAVLVKFDAAGNLLWHYVPTIPESFECRIGALAVDAQDQLYMGYHDFLGSRITKISPSGTPVSSIVQTQVRVVSSLAVDSSGNIYATGSCADVGANFNGHGQDPANLYNTYLVKYDATGDFQWLKYVEDVTCPNPKVFAATPDAVYFSSALFGPYSFDALQAEGPTGGFFSDFFLTKLDANGQYQWLREVPGEGSIALADGRALSGNADGLITVAGVTRGTTNWGSGWTTTDEGWDDQALLLTYDAQGNVVAATAFGGDGYDRCDAVTAGPSGKWFVTGMVNGNASFGGLTTTGTGNIPFIAQLESAPLSAETFSGAAVVLFPNPTSATLSLSGNQNHNATVYDLLGKRLMAGSLGAGRAMDVSGLSAGVYLLKIEDGQSIRFVKI